MARSNRVQLTQDAFPGPSAVPGASGAFFWLRGDGYVDVRCPHGRMIGAIPIEGPRGWTFRDLGGGRCSVAPSILLVGGHDGVECHFGPGEFPFAPGGYPTWKHP